MRCSAQRQRSGAPLIRDPVPLKNRDPWSATSGVRSANESANARIRSMADSVRFGVGCAKDFASEQGSSAAERMREGAATVGDTMSAAAQRLSISPSPKIQGGVISAGRSLPCAPCAHHLPLRGAIFTSRASTVTLKRERKLIPNSTSTPSP